MGPQIPARRAHCGDHAEGADALFPAAVGNRASLPVHEKTVRLGEGWGKPGKIMSNGAYILEDWKPSSHIRLVKNPNYWNAGKVAIDAVVFDPTENSSYRAETLSRRRVRHHNQRSAERDQLGWLKRNMPKELHIAPLAKASSMAAFLQGRQRNLC
jgi:ABC-type oligopeptide transport system substrate-binding subunit